MSEEAGAVRVAVAGGGLAGLTAALRLSQRGYQVTLYDDKPFLGGNAASHDHVHDEVDDGVYHDVYPHMYSNFYLNFWDIVQNDLGLRRDESPRTDFEARNSFKFLRPGETQYRELKNAGSLSALWGNLFSGIAPPLDMYLWSYSMLDLLAHDFHKRGILSQSVNGYVRSRPCATERVAALHDFVVMVIWSVHSTGTSVSSYRNFLLQAFGNLSPLLWLLKGSLETKIIRPWEKKLTDLGCKIHKQTRVEQISVDGGRISGMQVVDTDFEGQHHDVNAERHVTTRRSVRLPGPRCPARPSGRAGGDRRAGTSYRRSASANRGSTAPAFGADRRAGSVFQAQAERDPARERGHGRLGHRSERHRHLPALARRRTCRMSPS